MKALPLAAFWLLGILWGSSFIFMKLAAAHISPMQIVLLRVLSGFVLVAAFAGFTGALRWSHARHAGHILAMAVVGAIAYYYGFVKGASLLPSGVTGSLSGLTPILSFLLALLFIDEEKFTRRGLFGIATGFAGVLMIANPAAADLASASLTGVAWTVTGSLSVAASFVYARRFVLALDVPAIAFITYQLGLSALLLLLVTDLDGVTAIGADPGAALGLFLGLGVLGTGLAFILYYYIIDRMGAVSASSVAYIPPLVALAIGVLIAGETIAAHEYLGAALILLGVVLVRRPRRE